jgi:hypothetical protein
VIGYDDERRAPYGVGYRDGMRLIGLDEADHPSLLIC